MNRVTHFEIYIDDPEAVQPFYRDVFGWRFQKFEDSPIDYWLITTGPDDQPGINGGMTRPRERQSSGALNMIAVASLDKTFKEIEQRGGKFALRKWAMPRVGWLAYAEDPAGNVFGIIEPNEQAKQSTERKAMTTRVELAGAVVVERILDAPVAKVWTALTDVDEMRQWYFDLKEFKPEIGFEFQFVVEHEGNRYHHVCKITEVIPQRKIAYTWRYKGQPGDSLVTFELFPDGEKTRLRLTHTGIDTFPRTPAYARKNFEAGWTAIATELEQFLGRNMS